MYNIGVTIQPAKALAVFGQDMNIASHRQSRGCGFLFVYMHGLKYLHANEETRFAKRWNEVHPGRMVKRARRAAGRGETDAKGGNPDYWPERSP